MSNYPRYVISGGNQFPAVATAVPSQLPVIEIVDGTGATITNLGNGAADGTWTTMTLLAGTPGATPPAYMKDSRGIVHCRGQVTVGAANTLIFVLPVGFRTFGDTTYFQYATSNNATLVSTGGNITVVKAGVSCDLSVIHFPVALIP